MRVTGIRTALKRNELLSIILQRLTAEGPISLGSAPEYADTRCE